MAVLPEHLISKIMTYMSHPVADLFKAEVSISPVKWNKNPDEFIIKTHGFKTRARVHTWSTKENECLSDSLNLEEQVIFNKLKSIMAKLRTYDTFDCSKFKMINYMIRNLDPMFIHVYKKIMFPDADNWDKILFYLTANEHEFAECAKEFPSQ